MQKIIMLLVALLVIPSALGLSYLGPEAGFQTRGDITAAGTITAGAFSGSVTLADPLTSTGLRITTGTSLLNHALTAGGAITGASVVSNGTISGTTITGSALRVTTGTVLADHALTAGGAIIGSTVAANTTVAAGTTLTAGTTVTAGTSYLHSVSKATNATAAALGIKDVRICTAPFASADVTYPLNPINGTVTYVVLASAPGSYNLILDPLGAATIDGANTLSSTDQYSSVTLVSDGTNFFTVGKTGTWS